ncbi:MAG: hypothetical protein ACFFCH_00545 [Promethearchaeota archaeon]
MLLLPICAIIIADVFIFDFWFLSDYQIGVVFLFIGCIMMAPPIL